MPHLAHDADDTHDAGDTRDARLAHQARLAAYGAVSTALALTSDRALRELLEAAEPLGTGIGGKSALLEVAGTPVFVKRVPLTDLERQPENVHSTANLFDLPPFCQYNIAGPSFGTWRELAAHTMTTNWVLAGAYEGFPLMYHWRVLPDSAPLPDELADVEASVAYWGGGSAVRNQIEARRGSSASVALFLEYIPQNLHQWLGQQVEAGDAAVDAACAMVEAELEAGTAFMNDNGLLHMDVHFENILTDGSRLYFTDYGLATSPRFDLSPAEVDFIDEHPSYDRVYALSYLANWLVTGLKGLGGRERQELLGAYAQGKHPTGVPATAASILTRYAPLAVVVTEFFRKLRDESRQTPYPAEEIRRRSP
ncbi:hypothetical protein HY68_13700 [Streptomyces sp. AcH 505]|uniref:hypothetical protein n=1 Tax=Streptomyces sp. AcH 505 TaxID=352211 RepID=UPI0005918E43|nr:hypothetical protein HY68_13700 [Streptomyces sp. AcH 505]